ncbi:MAG: tetratricopeptide repeat protein [Bacteroidia bacterium]
MSSNIPTVKQVAWISIVPQLAVMALIMLIWYQFEKANFVAYGALTYLLISQVLRRTIPNEHRKGMTKVRREQFEEAIPHFENSYEFFKKHDWIDKYRFLTLLSSGKMSYKEMALNNIAFCYGQIGNGKTSKAYYERTLKEFPESGIAKAGLRLLNSMSNENETKENAI